MHLGKDQGTNVKVTIQPHPYVAVKDGGPKGANKSFILYECEVPEVLEFFMNALEEAGAAAEEDE